MTWFAVSVLLEGRHLGDVAPLPDSKWLENIVLIDALDESDASTRGEDLGRQMEHEYVVASPSPHVLRWEFRRLGKVYRIDAEVLRDGTEVFSRFLRGAEAAALWEPFDD